MNYSKSNSDIHCIARALIIRDNEILLCKQKDKDFYFLPGGHIENGEKAEDALLRELSEELQTFYHEDISFLGICENIFDLNKEEVQHEINFIFEVIVSDNLNVSSREDHLEFIFIPKEEVLNINMLPKDMIKFFK